MTLCASDGKYKLAQERQGMTLSRLLKYATSAEQNRFQFLQDGQYIGQRLGDKILFSLIMMSLYWGQGGTFNNSGMYNTSALLAFLTVS